MGLQAFRTWIRPLSCGNRLLRQRLRGGVGLAPKLCKPPSAAAPCWAGMAVWLGSCWLLHARFARFFLACAQVSSLPTWALWGSARGDLSLLLARHSLVGGLLRVVGFSSGPRCFRGCAWLEEPVRYTCLSMGFFMVLVVLFHTLTFSRAMAGLSPRCRFGPSWGNGLWPRCEARRKGGPSSDARFVGALVAPRRVSPSAHGMIGRPWVLRLGGQLTVLATESHVDGWWSLAVQAPCSANRSA